MKVFSAPIDPPKLDQAMVKCDDLEHCRIFEGAGPIRCKPPCHHTSHKCSGHYSAELHDQIIGAYLTSLREWLKSNGYKHRLTGEVVRFPRADGYAQYMVINGTDMMHLAIDDAWQIPEAHARGLRMRDIADLVAAQHAREALFSRPDRVEARNNGA